MDVLKEALATTLLDGSYRVDVLDSGDYPTAGGLDISAYGVFIGGDRGCLATLSPHTVPTRAYAYVAMSNASTRFTQITESYATVADARNVMRENRAQAETCRTFKMIETDELVTYEHTVTQSRDGEASMLVHHFIGRGQTQIYTFHMFEGRVGGEMMHLVWTTGTAGTDPSVEAFAHFQKIVGAYRHTSPRQEGAIPRTEDVGFHVGETKSSPDASAAPRCPSPVREGHREGQQPALV